MVSNISIVFMILVLVVSILFPISLFIYFHKKEKISIKPVLIGILIFIVFSQVLEKILHVYVFTTNPFGILKKPIVLAVYGALAAGIFEEVGRFVGFKYLLKDETEWKDGVAYGIGHGGIEAVIVGGLITIQYVIFSKLINAGLFEQSLAAKVPLQTLIQLKSTLVNTPFYLFGLGALERVFAMIIQIALSLLVLYGIKNKKYIYLISATAIHALFDLAAALYQTLKLNIWAVEGLIFIFALISLIYIRRIKRSYELEK